MKYVTFLFAHTLTTMVMLLACMQVSYAGGGYIPLTSGLPILGSFSSLPELLNTLVTLSVVVAAILAVIMIAMGGFKYMTTDSMFAMSGAKEQITNAIVGLLIVLAAILILRTINEDLVKMNLFNPN